MEMSICGSSFLFWLFSQINAIFWQLYLKKITIILTYSFIYLFVCQANNGALTLHTDIDTLVRFGGYRFHVGVLFVWYISDVPVNRVCQLSPSLWLLLRERSNTLSNVTERQQWWSAAFRTTSLHPNAVKSQDFVCSCLQVLLCSRSFSLGNRSDLKTFDKSTM